MHIVCLITTVFLSIASCSQHQPLHDQHDQATAQIEPQTVAESNTATLYQQTEKTVFTQEQSKKDTCPFLPEQHKNLKSSSMS